MAKIQPGDYYAKLVGGTCSDTKSGSSQVVVEFEVTAVEMSGEWKDCEPFKRSMYLSLSDKAWKYTEKKLLALGFNGDFGAGMDFEKKEFEVCCKHEEYQGETQERWDLDSWGGGAKERSPDSTIEKFGARWASKNAVAAS